LIHTVYTISSAIAGFNYSGVCLSETKKSIELTAERIILVRYSEAIEFTVAYSAGMNAFGLIHFTSVSAR